MGAVSTNPPTTFDLPNYVGELFNLTPSDTPLLSIIGGLTGGVSSDSTTVQWQTTDNTAAAQPAIVEGTTPTYETRDRANVTNVLQIFQYGWSVTYTKQAATGNVGGAAILGTQPVQDELSFQRALKLQRAARDVEYTFLRGAYQAPTDNSTGRKTRGLKNAISTNAVAASSAQLSKDHIDQLMRTMADAGAPMGSGASGLVNNAGERVGSLLVLGNAFQIQRFSAIYGYAPSDRTIGGVKIQTVLTDFGTINLVYDRHMETDQLFFVDVDVLAPAFLSIPKKGHFFVEELAHTGASWNYQLYGEIGLIYGPEKFHGKITGLATS